jgi:hypothetical protein
MHSLFLDAIIEKWPDVIVVRIHRNLEEAALSAIEFFSHLRGLSKPAASGVHETEVSQWIHPYLCEHERRVDRFDGFVVDVDAHALRSDPLSTVRYVKEVVRARSRVHT